MSYNSNSNSSNQSNKAPVFLVVFVMIVGVLFGCVGVVQRLEMKSKSEYFATTTGKIISYQQGKKGSTSAPVYEYEVNGFKYTYTESVSTAGKKEIGKEITIRYNPANPSEAFSDAPANSSFLFLAIGIFFFVVGFIMLLQIVEIFEKTVSDFITGLLISVIFIGFPIAFIVAIPGLPIIVKAIFLILILAGLFILISLIYRTFIKKDISESKPFVQHIDSIYDTPYGEQIDKLREKADYFKKYYVIASVIVGVIVFIFVAIQLPSKIKQAKEAKSTIPQELKKEISDKRVADYCGVSKTQVPEYIVYECEIIDRQEDTYFIKEVAGLPVAVLSEEDFEIGETIYWVEIPGIGRILYDKDEYTYSGNNTPENSKRYYIDGKCILSDRFITDYCGGEPTTIIKVKFNDCEGNDYYYIDDDGNDYSEYVPDEYLRYYSDVEPGDEYYYVVANHIVYYFSGDLYTCSK